MDLVRRIILALEDHPPGYVLDAPLAFPGFTEAQVGYHVLIMGEAELLNVQEMTGYGDSTPNAVPVRLTWAGHEFADAVRNDTVWNNTKARVGAAGSATLKVWVEVASKLLMQQIGVG
ncbi:MAG: DUF2513 domain-containing protein [Acidobacteriota bacterium]|nr:DUF2513 domain-containing protein [Acidobacteriota bacterium]